MARLEVDRLLLPHEVDRWAEEYAAHILAVENCYDRPFGPLDRAWRKRRWGPHARPYKFKPVDDQNLLDPEFDED